MYEFKSVQELETAKSIAKLWNNYIKRNHIRTNTEYCEAEKKYNAVNGKHLIVIQIPSSTNERDVIAVDPEIMLLGWEALPPVFNVRDGLLVGFNLMDDSIESSGFYFGAKLKEMLDSVANVFMPENAKEIDESKELKVVNSMHVDEHNLRSEHEFESDSSERDDD